MLTLLELQKQFADGLNEKNDSILSSIKISKAIGPPEQLNIYRSSLISSLQKISKEIYPVCEKLVGHDFFLKMIDQYISFNPSTSFDLNQYGESFADFIANITRRIIDNMTHSK